MFVYELARELKISTVELIVELKSIGIDVELPNPRLTEDQVKKIRSIYKKSKKSKKSLNNLSNFFS